MTKKEVFISFAIAAVFILSSCASIPQEAVTLNKEITIGITSIHESNIRLINQYFEVKIVEIDKYEKEALEKFFNEIATATTRPDAPPLGVKELHDIKEKVEEIHVLGNKYKAELNASKNMIIEKLQNEYNLIINANNSITGLLQSIVDIDKATNDGLSKINQFSDGRIDLTDIDSKISDYLADWGSSSVRESSLIELIQETLN